MRCQGGRLGSGGGTPWPSRQAARSVISAKIVSPIDKCRFIRLSGCMPRLMSGISQPTANCAASSTRISQWNAFATGPYA
jgi:hypothetical protein